MTKRSLRIVAKAPKLERPVGTSVSFVAYIPKEEHLRFMRQHDRSTGDLEKMALRYSWLQIICFGAAASVIAFGAVRLFL